MKIETEVYVCYQASRLKRPLEVERRLGYILKVSKVVTIIETIVKLWLIGQAKFVK